SQRHSTGAGGGEELPNGRIPLATGLSVRATTCLECLAVVRLKLGSASTGGGWPSGYRPPSAVRHHTGLEDNSNLAASVYFPDSFSVIKRCSSGKVVSISPLKWTS